MSNVKKTSPKKKAPAKKKKNKFEDDRTPFVKKVDIVCKLVAILLAICIFGSIHVLMGGGGYEDSKVVHVLGVAVSKVQTDYMEPEIEARSAVFASFVSLFVKIGLKGIPSDLGTLLRTIIVFIFASTIVFSRNTDSQRPILCTINARLLRVVCIDFC